MGNVRLSVAVIVISLALAPCIARAQCVFVNNNGVPNSVSAFHVAADGSLTAVTGGPFATGGNGLNGLNVHGVNNVAIVQRTLYATNSGSATVSGFAINPDCTLTALTGSPFADTASTAPSAVQPSANGKFLFVGLGINTSNGIDSFSIGSNGALSLVSGSPFGVGASAGADVEFDPARSEVVSDSDSSAVSVFSLNPNGTLTALPASPYSPLPAMPATDQRSIALRPQGDCAFVAEAPFRSGIITSFTVDTAGDLTASSTVTTDGLLSSIVLTPQGNFLYAADFGNIFAFSVGAGCKLTAVTNSPFPNGTNNAGLATDNTGRFLFVSDATADQVSSLAIAADGSLTSVTAPTALQGSSFGAEASIAFVPSLARTFNVTYYDVATSAAPSRSGYGGPGSSGGAGDNTVRIVNPTAQFGTTCAMIYVFDDFEELQACCGCPVTPDGLRTLSTVNDLTFDFGVNKGNLNAGTIDLVSSLPNFTPGLPPPGTTPPGTNGLCSPTGNVVLDPFARKTAVNPIQALQAWITHDEQQQPGNIAHGARTQTPSVDEFADSPLDQVHLFDLEKQCGFLIVNGSGAGTCTCGVGDNAVTTAKTRGR